MRSTAAPLKHQVQTLLQSFRRLRQRISWRRTQQGGVAVVEVTRNKATGLWHPHLHVLACGTFLRKSELVDNWRDASHGSFIVDIKAVTDTKDLSAYVCKYVTKPSDTEHLQTEDDARDYYNSLANCHRLITFGTMRNRPPQPQAEPPVTDWRNVMPLAQVIELAQRGDVHACKLLALLKEKDATATDVHTFTHRGHWHGPG